VTADLLQELNQEIAKLKGHVRAFDGKSWYATGWRRCGGEFYGESPQEYAKSVQEAQQVIQCLKKSSQRSSFFSSWSLFGCLRWLSSVSSNFLTERR
jgi:hypothetical protein